MTEKDSPTPEPKKPPPKPLPAPKRLQEADKALAPEERIVKK